MTAKLAKAMKLRLHSESRIFKGYRIGLISSSILTYDIFYNRSIIKKIGSIFKFLFTTPTFDKLPSNNCILYSIEREDYVELVESVKTKFSTVGREQSYSIDLISVKNKISGIREIYKTLFFLLEAKRIEGSVTWQIYCSFLDLYIIKGLEKLEKNKPKLPNTIIFFNSSSFPESLICDYYRNHGCLTVSLQHGLYLEPEQPQFDIINQSNIMAEMMLCWGEASKLAIEKLYQRFNLKQDFDIFLTGNPKQTAEKQPLTNTEETLILIPRYTFKKETYTLISILTGASLRNLKAKIHPSLEKDQELINILKTNNIEIEKKSINSIKSQFFYKRIIGFNTTALFEMLNNSNMVINYESGKNEFILPKIPSFSNGVELGEILSSKEHQIKRTDLYDFYMGKNTPNIYLTLQARSSNGSQEN